MRWLALLLVALFARDVHAQPGPSSPPEPPEPEWYGWKIAVSDGVAWGAMLGAIAMDDPDPEDEDSVNIGGALLVLGGMAWFEFGTPLVHLSEGNMSGAGTSFAMRFGMPLAGALVGHALDDENSPDDPYATAGIVVGALAATAIDVTFVAYKQPRSAQSWWPHMATHGGGLQLGVGGLF